MPYKIVENHESCPAGKPWGVVNKETGELKGCSKTKEKAKDHMAALYVHEEDRTFRDKVQAALQTVLNLFTAHDTPAELRAIGIGDIFDQIAYGARSEDHPYAWLQTLYLDDDGSMFAIYSDTGRLYRVPFSAADGAVTMGDWEPVVVQFEKIKEPEPAEPPAEQRIGTTRVFRDANGKARWISMSATAMLNRVGEIDSTDLFDSFIAHAQETGEYPFRTFMHLGEKCRYGQADYLAREGFVYITSGVYDEESELAKLEIRALESDEASEWGESIGYTATAQPELVEIADGIKVLVFRQGINTEISLCPQSMAASYFTAPSVQREVGMNPMTYEALLKLCGGDEAEAKRLAGQIDGTNAEIGDGRVARIVAETTEVEAQPEVAPVEEAQVTVPESAPSIEIELDDEMIARIAEQVAERLQAVDENTEALFKGLTERIEAISVAQNAHMQKIMERVQALEQDEDERLSELAADMPAPRARVTYRPRQDEQVVDEADADAQVTKILEAIPGHNMWPSQ